MKILIITANFAPRGASSAIRPVNFVKYLKRQGHKVNVITYDTNTLTVFSPPDVSLSEKVPLEVEVKRVSPGPLRKWILRQKAGSYEEKCKIKENAKNNLFLSLLIPDPHIDSILNFFREGVHQIKSFAPDVLLTFGYPFSIHIVGALLKRCYPKICWVADYGDPWSGSPISELPRPVWRKWIDYQLERVLLHLCDIVTVTTDATKELYLSLFPFLSSRIEVLPMGFDPEDFENISPKPRPAAEEELVWFVHTGRLYSEARDPKAFVNALSILLQDDPNVRNKIKVYFVGEVEDSIKAYMLTLPAKDVIKFIPWVPVRESIAWMKAADFLLLFGNRGGVQIPGKIYQYLGSGRPIFMIKLFEADPTVKITLSTEDSIIVMNDEKQILKALRSVLSRHRVISRLKGIGYDSPYAWSRITQKFSEIVQQFIKKEEPY
ncbi:glycosyltransferase [Thermovenabulum sp.]|uniref:glycosyltransferase n=1 Tax=Thermovenabulum sp. TaxID=3100335 RepID=UPI003C7B41CC